jgi:hypothetical protein
VSDYNPFDKLLRDVEASDLNVLRTVSEGWYVEYKSEVPKASAIAKSIAAFANTYGGWLFYGIAEKPGAENVADQFPGIARDAVDATLQRIRQAVAQGLNPCPHFDTRVIWGPEETIGLEADCGIICITIPRGHAAPFIHNGGHIYRRVADGSEPRPESDRFVLDQLWRRGEDVRKDYADWLERDLELSQAEDQNSYLRLFISRPVARSTGMGRKSHDHTSAQHIFR